MAATKPPPGGSYRLRGGRHVDVERPAERREPMTVREGTSPDHRTLLPRLLDRVVQARAQEQAVARAPQRPGGNTVALAEARQATLQALLDYADAIEALSWPVPRCIQMEIRMHRIVCGPTRRP